VHALFFYGAADRAAQSGFAAPHRKRIQPRRPRQAIAPQKFLNTLSDLYTGQFEIQGKFG
jgi:hypothetical protein